MRLDESSYRTFVAHAKAERRSLSNWIELAALQYLLESEFSDSAETKAILADRPLERRLRQGLRDAAHRKGRMIG